MKRTIYPVELKAAGLSVLLAELTPSELVNAMKLAGNSKSQVATGIDIGQAGLRLSLREINGEAVTYDQVEGDGIRRWVPRTRHVFALARAWSSIHQPTEAELERIETSAAWSFNGERETLTVRLLDGRAVELVEQPPETVREALAAGELGAKSQSAQAFLMAMESGRKSIRAIDGEPADLDGRRWDQVFSVKETFLVGHAWGLLHMGDDQDAALGEALPVSGG